MCYFFQNRTQFATGGPFSLKNGPVCALGRSLKVLAKQNKNCIDKNIKNHCLYKLKRVIGNAEHCLPQLVTRFWDDSLEAVFYASVVQSGRLGVLSGTPGSLQGSQTLRFKSEFLKNQQNRYPKIDPRVHPTFDIPVDIFCETYETARIAKIEISKCQSVSRASTKRSKPKTSAKHNW
mgnify:CR=1 FL=1